MKKRDLKLTPKELKKKQQNQAKWFMIKPFIAFLVPAMILIVLSNYFYLSNQCYLSDLTMSIGGGTIAGMVVYILGNIKQKNLNQAKEQGSEIRNIKEIFIKTKSLVVRILKLPIESLFFTERSYCLQDNISSDELEKQLKKCLEKIDNININKLTILKKYNKDLYNGLENYLKQDLYNDIKSKSGKELISKLESKKDLLFGIIFEFEYNLGMLENYIENISIQIL